MSTVDETVIRAIQSSLIHGQQFLVNLPKLVLKVGKGRLWSSVSPRGRGPFVDFADFASHPLPDGLGCEVGRLIELCRGNVEAEAFLKAECRLAQSADPPPRVIHWRDRGRHDRVCYVGRAAPRQGLEASPFGNPYRVDVDGTRAEVIEKYRGWILSRPELHTRLYELRGRVLACWCRPEPCHADVLAELVDADETIETLLAAGVRPEAAGDRLRLHPAEPGGTVPPELVERARSQKEAILSLLAAKRRLRPEELWSAAIDRLAAGGVIPPEYVDACKAASVKYE